MNILGIETSCDETAAAVVADGTKMLSNVVVSQIDIHAEYGGVIPEIAARSHIEAILPVVNKALSDAFGTAGSKKLEAGSSNTPDTRFQIPDSDPWDNIDAIAVTQGPGLIGSLLIGTLTARTLAILKNKPLIPVNHVVAHTYANFITGSRKQEAGSWNGDAYDQNSPAYPRFPLLSLSVSGGHSHLLLFNGHNDYRLLGATLDDAAGEAFDKVAKILGLPYPGGPSVSKAALEGDPNRYDFPKANLGRDSLAFSFSGLKTAVLRLAQHEAGLDISAPSSLISDKLSKQQINDIAASFQRIICETLVDKLELAAKLYQPKSVVVAGGVAANQALRDEVSRRLDYEMHYAPMSLCTDNAAMIASLAYFVQEAGTTANPHTLMADSSLTV